MDEIVDEALRELNEMNTPKIVVPEVSLT